VLLIVGLGNPGREYAAHRHNVGFMVVDELAARTAASFKTKFSGELARAQLEDNDALLLKPMTFMNLSGDSVQPCQAFYKLKPSQIMIVHDELDLPFGTIRLKQGGGAAGHKGLRSIIGRMGGDFRRLRFGIGRPPADFRGDVSGYVLSGFSTEEREQLPKYVEIAAKTVLDIAARGWEAAMKTRNTRPKKKRAPKAKPTEGEQAAAEQQRPAESAPPTEQPAAEPEPTEGS
jgi:PTH1 family peptidyl-tRNA hydrolase